MAEATDGGLKCFVRVSVKVSGLEGLVLLEEHQLSSLLLLSFSCHLALLSGWDGLACCHLSLQDG